MQLETIILSAFTTIFSIGLLLISLTSYRKYRNPKLLFVSFVFLVFFIKGVLLSSTLFSNAFTFLLSNPLTGFFDVIILLLLFIATLKR
jgi:hypothetical protein